MAKAMGTDESVTTCDCCGRSNLKFTVAIELSDGEIVHYGQVCARRNTGKTQGVINSEIKSVYQAAVTAARLAYRESPEYLSERARFLALDFSLKNYGFPKPGNASYKFLKVEVEAALVVLEKISSTYRVSTYDVIV